jgi:C4-dicarboxylate-specific signal transduction histidine kinase
MNGLELIDRLRISAHRIRTPREILEPSGKAHERFKLSPATHVLGALLRMVDKIQIQQVLLNLLRNALEAMQTSERHELTVLTRPADDNMVAVDVADTGNGISPDVRHGYSSRS